MGLPKSPASPLDMASATRGTAALRFDGLAPRSVRTSRVGAANVREHTAPELVLRRALWAAGLRYRLHPVDLPGRPDLVLPRVKMAVFCDGDFWHGRNWRQRKAKLSRGWNGGYWVAKLERNRRRDREVTRQLRGLGWTVLRFWETDVQRDPPSVVMAILRASRT